MQILAKSAILTHLRGLALRATAPAREGARYMGGLCYFSFENKISDSKCKF